MKHYLPVIIGILGSLICWGCATRISSSTADGTYLNFNGEAVNVYKGPPAMTIQAGVETLASMKIPVLSRHGGRHETIITAQAPDGAPLRLRFVDQGRDLTLLLIRTGTVGFWDHEFSFQLHASLHKQMMSKVPPETERDPPPEAVSAISPMAIGTGASRPRTALSDAPPTPAPKQPQQDPAEPRRKSKVGQTAPRTAAALPSPPEEKNVPPQRTPPDATVFFDADSNLPGPQEITKLDRAALHVLADPSMRMMLTGYAARTENEGRARLVSQNRVLAVKFYLIGRGVPADRITVVAHEVIGDETPSDPQEARRVVIRIYSVP